MKKYISVFVFILISCNYSYTQIIGNGWKINTPSNFYWVYNGGAFVLDNQNNNLLEIPNVKIENESSLEVSTQTSLTISTSLEQDGTGTLMLKSDATGTASLITAGTVIGNSNANKYLASSNPYGWPISTPIQETPQSVFSGHLNTYYYNALMPGWVPFTTGNMEIMRGYWTKFSDNHTLQFTGELNTGNISFTELYRTDTLGFGNFGWNLIGNPYPSAIDWDEVIAVNGGVNFLTTSKLNNAIYIANHDGAYKTYVNGIGVPQGFEGIVPANEAFWVQISKIYYDGNNPTAPILNAKLDLSNTTRLHENLVSGQNKSQSSGIIRLFVQNGMLQDEIVVRLMPNATPDFDPAYDAHKMFADGQNITQLYMSLSNNKNLVVNCLPENISLPHAISLGIKSQAGQQHQFKVNLTTFDQPHIDVYLEDKLTGTFTDLRLNNTYSYMSVSDNEFQRFVLHLGALSHIDKKSINQVNIYTYQNTVYVTGIQDNTLFELYNMVGQLILSENFSPGTAKIHTDVSMGFYVVRLTEAACVNSKKVFLGGK